MSGLATPMKNSSSRSANASPRSDLKRSGLKRPVSAVGSPSGSLKKRPRLTESKGEAKVVQSMQRAKTPVGEPWPLNDLRAFDAPTEAETGINHGPLLKQLMVSRGWIYSLNVCHGEIDKDKQSSFHIKEFEATVRGETPQKLFGKAGSVEKTLKGAKYQLKAIPLPKHALWMMGRLPFFVPGKFGCREREDFIDIVVEHGQNLSPSKPGNYKICKFPRTEKLLWKTELTEAFKDKSWYPQTFELPRDKAIFLKEIRSRGTSKNNMWIGKPRNDYGGCGINVWKGTDRELTKKVNEATQKQILQYYLADPLLVGGYKFHMRIHLVITNVEPLQAYVQENGQCLFATKPYTLSDKTLGKDFDPPVHVTNMGLNTKPKNKENFFKKKPVIGAGQQIRMSELMSHLAANQRNFNKKDMWQQILTIAADTASYIGAGIRQQTKGKIVRDRHFELFGMDLMLDKDMKVWMCEVNTDPGLGFPSQKVLGSPNPDYEKEQKACEDTWHDLFTLLGLDANRKQTEGSLKHWFKLDFPAAQ